MVFKENPMISVNIHEAKTHFSKLINQTLSGEEVIIARGNIPLVKLIPFHEEPSFRQGGQLKGMLIVEDNFDDPLPNDYLKLFYNEE
jgi:antitoxin (DNA-binding transcriptional repressor) of toxin-antitoxin stability system